VITSRTRIQLDVADPFEIPIERMPHTGQRYATGTNRAEEPKCELCLALHMASVQEGDPIARQGGDVEWKHLTRRASTRVAS
jgi:hypothetical protein